MKVLGIIAEYNPFHNGHQYQIETMKERLHADYCVVVMSGDFVQRGAPAAIDKYVRTKMALLGGADMVIAMPVCYSTSSAEGFAYGGVKLLQSLQVIDFLTYGCETDCISTLQTIASCVINESESYKENLRSLLCQGQSYAAARSRAIKDALKDNTHISLQELEHILQSPNAILGIEYEKAILQMKPGFSSVPLKRKQADYHSLSLSNSICSATALRKLLREQLDPAHYIPESSAALLQTYLTQQPILSQDSFSSYLRYQLLLHREEGYDNFVDCSPALSRRIQNNLDEYTGFTHFCHLLHTKEMTYSRISRVLIHILLNLTKIPSLSYAQVLGFRKDASPLVSEVFSRCQIPLITSVSNAQKGLPLLNDSGFTTDLFARDLYRHCLVEQGGVLLPSEYRQSMILI